MRMLRLKLILLFRSIPNNDLNLRELLERFGLIERFTTHVDVAGERGTIRRDEAREWLDKQRSEAIAELTVVTLATVAMLVAIVGGARG